MVLPGHPDDCHVAPNFAAVCRMALTMSHVACPCRMPGLAAEVKDRVKSVFLFCFCDIVAPSDIIPVPIPMFVSAPSDWTLV